MRKSHHSLHGLLRRSLLRSVVCMILPVCVLAGLLVVLTQRYGADIALTTRASEVRTVLVQAAMVSSVRPWPSLPMTTQTPPG